VTNKLTWDWGAGFYQAEGCVSGYYANSNPQLLICIKDTATVDLIEEFLHHENHQLKSYRYSYVHHTTFNVTTMEHYSIHARKNLQPIIDELYPRIYHGVREKVTQWADLFNVRLPDNRLPLNWDFVAGFWEGDGYISKAPSPGSVYFGFVQKEPEILKDIYTFVGKGNIRKFKPDNSDYAHDLRIFDGRNNNNEISATMLQHIRSQTCRDKLSEALKYSESEYNKYQEKYRSHSKQDWKEHLEVSKYLKEHPEVVAEYQRR